jgi:hypothetical protein
MSWFFEGSCFVVKDLRDTFNKIVSSGYPYDWRGRAGGAAPHSLGPKEIKHVIYHQTYGSIQPGEKGPLRTAQFLTADPQFKCKKCGHGWKGSPDYPSSRCPKCAGEGQNTGVGRGFPKMSYHVFVPFQPQRNEAEKFIIYYCVDFQERTWHSKEGNKNGVGVAFQGRFNHPSLSLFRPTEGTDGQPSAAQQQICMPLWYEWLFPLMQKTRPQLMGHWQWGKAACPGGWIQSRILEAHGQYPALSGYELGVTPPSAYTKSELFDTIKERQAALVLLGYDLGPYGPHKNGVDGQWGESCRAALHSFEVDVSLREDGNWDAETEQAMINVFKANDLGADHLKAVMKGEWPLAERPTLAMPRVPPLPRLAPEIEVVAEIDSTEEATAEDPVGMIESSSSSEEEETLPGGLKSRKSRKRDGKKKE